MRVRLKSGRRAVKKRSRRWPVSSAATMSLAARAKSRGTLFLSRAWSRSLSRTLSETLSKASSTGVCFEVMSVGGGPAALLARRGGLRMMECRGMFHSATQNPSADHNQSEADDLHQRKPAMKEQRAVRIGAHKFDQAALEAVKEHIGCENLACEALLFREEY